MNENVESPGTGGQMQACILDHPISEALKDYTLRDLLTAMLYALGDACEAATGQPLALKVSNANGDYIVINCFRGAPSLPDAAAEPASTLRA